MRWIQLLLFFPFFCYSQCDYKTIKQDNYILKQFLPKVVAYNYNTDFALSTLKTKNIYFLAISIGFEKEPSYLEKKIYFEFDNLSIIELSIFKLEEPEIVDGLLSMQAIIILTESDIKKFMNSNLKSFTFKFKNNYKETLLIKKNFDYISKSLKCFKNETL